MTSYIKTDEFSAHLRDKCVDLPSRRLLISNLRGSEQEPDLTVPPNCNGFGRVRHFKRQHSGSWPRNPLPIDPACRALVLPAADLLRAQVFQNAGCNWRCWYCFVPFRLLDARSDAGAFLSAHDLVELYLAEPEERRPVMIDLTGGQPDLVPEWVPWMMQELRDRDLESKVYLWSDDNLSNDYFWRYLTEEQRTLVRTFKGYGRVACFKGFDEKSFAFNTRAEPELFRRQFDLFGRMLATGVDLYAYATFTTPDAADVESSMSRFVDQLQAIHSNLPLRTVPLEVTLFGVVEKRVAKMKLPVAAEVAVQNQWLAIEAWQRELNQRFTASERAASIVDVPLRAAA